MQLPTESGTEVDLNFVVNCSDEKVPDSITNFNGLKAIEYIGQDGNLCHIDILQIAEEAVGEVAWVSGPLINLQVHAGQPRVQITICANDLGGEITVQDMGEWLIYEGNDDLEGGLNENRPPMLVRPAEWDPENTGHWRSLPLPKSVFTKIK